MAAGIPVKKLIKTAFYSSVILVGALAISPHVIIFKAFVAHDFFRAALFLSLFMLLIWAINISVVYLVEKYGQGRYAAYKRYIFSYAIILTCIFSLKQIIDSYVHNASQAPTHLYAVVILSLFLNTIVLIITDLVLLREKKSIVEIENAALKLKNAEATNQQLKQQIHPHFLFNSLSTLKSLINKDPAQAEDYLIKLSDFLRASLLSSTPNTVRLHEEIKLCMDYLDMQKMRFGKALQFTINIPQDILESVSVPVFSVLPLLENAIKHNILTQELPLHIQVEYVNGRIIVSNNLQARSPSGTSIGLGLENLSERYRILSGDEVIIRNDGKTFSVSIKTLANEDSNNRR